MRYTKTELLEWAKAHHYPQLVLSVDEYVKHGELHWRRMARDKERRELAWKRIEMWNARTQEKIA